MGFHGRKSTIAILIRRGYAGRPPASPGNDLACLSRTANEIRNTRRLCTLFQAFRLDLEAETYLPIRS